MIQDKLLCPHKADCKDVQVSADHSRLWAHSTNEMAKQVPFKVRPCVYGRKCPFYVPNHDRNVMELISAPSDHRRLWTHQSEGIDPDNNNFHKENSGKPRCMIGVQCPDLYYLPHVCQTMHPEHLKLLLTTTGGDFDNKKKLVCKKGTACPQLSKSAHSSRYSHADIPVTPLSTGMPESCPFGLQCELLKDPEHRKMYIHQMPLCKLGANCKYMNNNTHMQNWTHPTAESPANRYRQEDIDKWREERKKNYPSANNPKKPDSTPNPMSKRIFRYFKKTGRIVDLDTKPKNSDPVAPTQDDDTMSTISYQNEYYDNKKGKLSQYEQDSENMDTDPSRYPPQYDAHYKFNNSRFAPGMDNMDTSPTTSPTLQMNNTTIDFSLISEVAASIDPSVVENIMNIDLKSACMTSPPITAASTKSSIVGTVMTTTSTVQAESINVLKRKSDQGIALDYDSPAKQMCHRSMVINQCTLHKWPPTDTFLGGYGFVICSDERGHTLKTVVPNSPAAAATLVVNDHIMKVNDVFVTQFSKAEVTDLINLYPETVNMQVVDGYTWAACTAPAWTASYGNSNPFSRLEIKFHDCPKRNLDDEMSLYMDKFVAQPSTAVADRSNIAEVAAKKEIEKEMLNRIEREKAELQMLRDQLDKERAEKQKLENEKKEKKKLKKLAKARREAEKVVLPENSEKKQTICALVMVMFGHCKLSMKVNKTISQIPFTDDQLDALLHTLDTMREQGLKITEEQMMAILSACQEHAKNEVVCEH